MNWFSMFEGLLLATGFLIGGSPLCAQEPELANPNPPQGSTCQHHANSCPDKKRCGCEHVYIFGIDGFNPCNLGKFNEFCDYLRDEGYENTFFYHLHDCWAMGRKIRQVRLEDPDARIVLIGFSAGCCCVRSVTESLARDCIQVDLLVYMAGDFVKNKPSWHPDNVCRVLNIRAKGYIPTGGDLFFNGADLDGAHNCRLEIRHISTPSNPDAVGLVMEELQALSCAPEAPVSPQAPAVPEGN